MNTQAHIIIHHRRYNSLWYIKPTNASHFFRLFSSRMQDFAAISSMGAVLKILITRRRASLSLSLVFLSFFFPHLIHSALALALARTMMRTGFFAAPQRSGVDGIKQILTRQVCFLPLLLHFCAAAAAAAVAGAGRFFLRQNEVFTTQRICYLSWLCHRFLLYICRYNFAVEGFY